MGKILRSFRSKMIMLLGLSMLLSSAITYLLFKVLQLYYYTNVSYGDTLAYFRKIIQNIGDLNVFLLLFILLSIL
ncbi:VanF-type vancomycin resistance histidine kinase VanS, partial [Brevibacillus laterosporus]|nr:VanF-type vancomycin resistance histidine kinase VanS [Brevibacillus laterosporus]